MLKLIGYNPGDNLTVMNVMYEKPRKEGDQYLPDVVHIVFKDNNTGLKQIQSIKSPKYTYYMAKPEIQIPFNLEWIPVEQTYPVTCNYRDIKASIAKETGNLDLYKENLRTGN